jgi:endonuclease/exonuclease/phosphatase family metal-dependent hydrolase
MRIMTLNTWGGRAGKEELLAFLKSYADTTDIFCLQEIWSAPYEHLEGHSAGGLAIDNNKIMVYGRQEITASLPNHKAFFRALHGDDYGLLMLVHKDLPVTNEDELYVYREKGFASTVDVGDHARSIQYATLQTPRGALTVINFHGLWQAGAGKVDNPDRLEQSAKIAAFINSLATPVVFCGDFNLLPDTESVRRLEETGLRNLVTEFGITSTRTRYYQKPEKFADYVFTSQEVQVKDFKVLPDEVSDHAPLMIDIN